MSKVTTVIEDKKYLIEAVLPEATLTYTVIPHELIINTVCKLIAERGFTIIKEIYKYNTAAQVACGIYHLSHSQDDDMGMLFTWTNSYDKSVRFKCFVGAYIKINGNVLVSNSDGGVYKRKHTGESDKEVEATIFDQLNSSLSYYDELVRDKEKMKTKEISDKEFAELCGNLYITEKLITTEQISIIKQQFLKPSYNYDCGKNCVWTFYNYILTGIIKCHPSKWVEQQRMIHIWMKNYFGIGDFVPLRPSKEHNQHVPALDMEQIFNKSSEAPVAQETLTPAEEEIKEHVQEAIEQYPETLEKLEDNPVTPEPVIEQNEIQGRAEILKSTIHQMDPAAEVGNIISLNGMDFFIEDEDDDYFTVVQVEADEDEPGAYTAQVDEPEPVEEPEPVKETPVFTLPPHPGKKLTAVAPSISAKEIQIIPPAVREIDPKILDEIRNKISQRIFDLYGGIREFSYVKAGNQYNILLESGECLSLINL